jgi:hypothetical protein
MRRASWPNGNCTYDYRFGMQETKEYYDECRQRSRNKGLFTADQRLRGNGAHYTRQNTGGQRYGYECPEEKDYYPYWGPSPWRDLAILTDEPSRCAAFQAASQNTQERWVCRFDEEMHAYAKERRWTGYVPITEEECVRPKPLDTCGGRAGDAGCLVVDDNGRELNLGYWERVDAHGIPEPLCLTPDHERSNTLSNPYNKFGHEAGFNWTIPDWFVNQYQNELDPERCVIRIRHNTTSHDVGFTDHGYASPTSIEAGVADHTMNSVNEDGEREGNYYDYPTRIPVWERFGMTEEDVAPAFRKVDRDNGVYGRGYVFGNEPKVDIFGDLLGNVAPLYLNLAINTQKVPRTFQDRTHGFVVRKRPSALEGYDIINLSVKGKRGNIVQTWPAHEYDFQPSPLEVKSGSFLHIQWNGANTNPRNNAGEGPNGFDRSNIIMLAQPAYEEATKMDPATGEEIRTFGQYGRSYPGHFGFNPENPNTPEYKDGQDAARFLGWGWQDNFILSTPPLFSGYFDFGLRQVTTHLVKTTYNYLGTRNNNFSNRSQKGKVTVLPRTEEDGPEPVVDLPDRDALLSIPGVAYIQYDWDERMNYQQNIQIHVQERMKGFDSNWIKVDPRVISMPDYRREPGNSMPDWNSTIQLNMYHDWKPFNLGRIYWSEKADPENYDLIQMNTEHDMFSWGSTARASAWIDQGGYYVVKNELNYSALGGFLVGTVLLVMVSMVIFKKFGCRFVGGKVYAGADDPLMASDVTNAPRSDAASTTTTAGHTSGTTSGV